jgi:hypothetical protein
MKEEAVVSASTRSNYRPAPVWARSRNAGRVSSLRLGHLEQAH